MKTLKTIKSALIATLAMLVAAPIFSSCIGDNDDPKPTGHETTSLVTLEGNVELRARFTFIPEGDGATRTMLADKELPKEVKAGQRMVIRYIEIGKDNYTGFSNISLVSFNSLPTVEVEKVSTEEAQAANEEIFVNAINRTGKYINLEANVKKYTERTYYIYADEATLENPTPDLYITTKTKGDYSGVKYLDIASFDISMIWSRIDCKGVNIHINNSNPSFNKKVFEFRK